MVEHEVVGRRGIQLTAALALGLGLAVLGLIATAPSASAATTASVSGGRLTVTGTGGPETIVVSAVNPSTIRVTAPGFSRTFPASSVSSIRVVAGGGNDTVKIQDTALAFTVTRPTTLDGGGGNDTLTGGRGPETLLGGIGNDTATGAKGKDNVNLGGGADVAVWSVGHAADTVVGGPGADLLRVNGSAGAEDWRFSSEGVGQLQFFGGPSGVPTIAATTIESLAVTPGAGADTVGVIPSASSGVTVVDIELGSAGVADAFADQVRLEGTGAADVVQSIANGVAVQVNGLASQINVTNAAVANDALHILGQGGNDTLSGGALSGLIAYRVDGGPGNDTINGSNGADQLIGGDDNDSVDGNQGNDTAFLGDGADTALWDPGDGSDIVEGQSDRDTLRFNGSAGAEIFTASSNGGRLLFTRNVGNIIMDTDDIENLELNALGNADTVTVNDLEATDVDRVDLDLGVANAGDGAVDSVTINGTVAEDSLQATILGGELTVRSPAVDVVIDNPELANDVVTINTSGGNDTIVAGAGTNLVRWTFNGGNDADLLSGSPGNDALNGEVGNDVILGNAGIDTLNGGTNTDLCDGGADADVHGGGCETLISIP